MNEEQKAKIWENILRIQKNKIHIKNQSQIKILDGEEYQLKKILFKNSPPKERN